MIVAINTKYLSDSIDSDSILYRVSYPENNFYVLNIPEAKGSDDNDFMSYYYSMFNDKYKNISVFNYKKVLTDNSESYAYSINEFEDGSKIIKFIFNASSIDKNDSGTWMSEAHNDFDSRFAVLQDILSRMLNFRREYRYYTNFDVITSFFKLRELKDVENPILILEKIFNFLNHDDADNISSLKNSYLMLNIITSFYFLRLNSTRSYIDDIKSYKNIIDRIFTTKSDIPSRKLYLLSSILDRDQLDEVSKILKTNMIPERYDISSIDITLLKRYRFDEKLILDFIISSDIFDIYKNKNNPDSAKSRFNTISELVDNDELLAKIIKENIETIKTKYNIASSNEIIEYLYKYININIKTFFDLFDVDDYAINYKKYSFRITLLNSIEEGSLLKKEDNESINLINVWKAYSKTLKNSNPNFNQYSDDELVLISAMLTSNYGYNKFDKLETCIDEFGKVQTTRYFTNRLVTFVIRYYVSRKIVKKGFIFYSFTKQEVYDLIGKIFYQYFEIFKTSNERYREGLRRLFGNSYSYDWVDSELIQLLLDKLCDSSLTEDEKNNFFDFVKSNLNGLSNISNCDKFTPYMNMTLLSDALN